MTSRKLARRVGALALLTALATFQTANAATATSLYVGFCPLYAPCPPGPAQVVVGQAFTFFVDALDADKQFATDYTNTVTITTNTGVVATLPPPEAAPDNAMLAFSATIDQLPAGSSNPALVTITATDNNGLTGSMQFPVSLAQQTDPTPALSSAIKLMLGGTLVALALIALRKRRCSRL